MTFSMVNTLRIIDSTHERSVSLKSVCTCLQKREIWVETGEERACCLFFSK